MRQKYAYTVNILLKKTLIEEAFYQKRRVQQLFNASTLKKDIEIMICKINLNSLHIHRLAKINL